MQHNPSSVSATASDVRCVLDARAALGECPVWSAETQCLYWVDIGDWPASSGTARASLHRLDPASGVTRHWPLPQPVGSFALDRSGGVLLALSQGLYQLDLESDELRQLVAAPYDTAVQRFNDGRCDPAGRFWVGTCQVGNPAVPAGAGALYSYDGHSLQAQVHGISAANGLAWSPDGRTMYFADSRQRTVWAFDYDVEQGRASRHRVFLQAEAGVVLDGAAVDAEGGYWIAQYDAGKVVRYRADGTLDREVRMPVSKPTMVAFGGPGMQTLYVTSASHRMSAEQREAQPQAGGIFAFKPGVAGLPEPRFVPSAMKRS